MGAEEPPESAEVVAVGWKHDVVSRKDREEALRCVFHLLSNTFIVAGGFNITCCHPSTLTAMKSECSKQR